MPDLKLRTAAKFWMGLAAVCATAVAGTVDAPWLTIAAAALGAAGVYLVPNAPAE
jgi:hypothetical protein